MGLHRRRTVREYTPASRDVDPSPPNFSGTGVSHNGPRGPSPSQFYYRPRGKPLLAFDVVDVKYGRGAVDPLSTSGESLPRTNIRK